MKKITRPVMKHLAEINFRNWDRIDELIGALNDRLKDDNRDYFFYLHLRLYLKKVRDNIKFIDETFRDYLEKE